MSMPPLDRDPAADPALEQEDPPALDQEDPALASEVDMLVADVVASVLDGPDDDDNNNLRQLHAEAVEASARAVLDAEHSRLDELAATGRRLREEQERLYRQIMDGLPGAVREAAAAGRRVATLLCFEGQERFSEFCYLYMLKGPIKAEQRAEMRAMGCAPLLPRLRRELQAAGFGVYHSWQRATNDNTLSIMW